MIELAKEDGLDGLDLDYENMHPENRDLFSAFVKETSEKLHGENMLLGAAVHAKRSDGGTGPEDWFGPKAQDWAEKMFDVREHDFMSLARGAKAEYRFVIKNHYKHQVHISSVRSSCGCTDPRLSARTLQPGETAFLVTEFNTIRFDGAHNATVTVTFDKPYQAEVRLQIKGFVRKDVVFSPGRIELGLVDEGATVEKKVVVTYAGRSDWKIVDIRSENSHFEVELN
ncbi:MAG: DUF1573 domain-containing protein, partial [Proteobacteria bacterium]|nr:DUF1573 domain-containing protein [Pseudomonadota bacterium]